MLKGFEDKTARAECRIGLARPGKEIITFTGLVEGKIVEPRGTAGFGWDSIFQPDGSELTYAEMEPGFKNTVSDRSKAIELMKNFLRNNPDWL